MKGSVFPMAQTVSRRRIPRWAWISGASAIVLVPVLLGWAALAILGGARQGGSDLVEQVRGWVGLVAPEVVREADAAVAQVREAAEALAPLAADPVDAARATVDASIAEITAAVREPLAELGTEVAANASAASALAGAAALAGQEGAELAAQGRASLGAALDAVAPLPRTDVAGEDPDGFTRMPGFVRTAFRRGDDGVVATYAGVAPQAEVMAFHREALEQAGYAATVQSADANAITIEFRREGRILRLSTQAEVGGRTRLEVRGS
jgi:hypothetical protein